MTAVEENWEGSRPEEFYIVRHLNVYNGRCLGGWQTYISVTSVAVCPPLSGAYAIATLMVYASDPTFGSVSWESSVYFISEPNRTASVLTAYILRGPGSAGHIAVSYG